MTQAQVLAILKTGANVFLTGEPGSGKTHTVNAYVDYLRRHGIEPAITASTGIAATHIHGMTVHAWSGIGVRESLNPQDLARIAGNARVAKRITRAKVLLIDEVSMLDGRQLDMVDAVCRQARRSSQPFGGLQAVLVGDFFQLPPVARNGAAVQFAFASQSWQAANPVVCYLAEQHRQADAVFLSVLAGIRKGQVSSQHGEQLQKRLGAHPDVSENLPRLYSHNVDVDRMNEMKLEKLPGAEKEFLMTARGPAQLVAALKRGCLSPEILRLKNGAVVMFTKNSPAGRFVNGTLATVSGFDDNSGLPIVKTRSGRRLLAETMEWSIEEQGRMRARIRQVPLRLAWAITIHKSQGMSMDAAVMDLSGAFEFGQGYVAISRVRTLAGLHLLGCNRRALEVHPQIFEQDLKFRQAANGAKERFSQIAAEQLARMQRDFIISSGGRLQPAAGDEPDRTRDTYELTRQLAAQKISIEQISRIRQCAHSTVMNHLEKLRAHGKLSPSDLEYLKLQDAKIQKAFAEIGPVFGALGRVRLKPVYDHFAGQYDYDILRLIRLLL